MFVGHPGAPIAPGGGQRFATARVLPASCQDDRQSTMLLMEVF